MNNKSTNLPTSYSAMLMPILLCSLVVTHILNSPNSLYAQSSPITSSGLKTEVLDSDTTHTIMGGTRHGTNLFHSFDTFNVPRTHIANFQNDSGANTSNILARVTGDNPSLIFGTIRTTGFKDASLFLMNPAGIVFGPEATLNVGGSVTFTTADYLRLATPGDAQAGFFHANPNSAPIFTSAPVTAYGFLTDNSAAIAIRGSQLSMQPDQSISLIAGKHGFSYIDPITGQTSVPGGITVLGGALSAPNGHINIGSIASPGELQSTTLEPSSNIQGNSPNSFGNITLSENAVMNTSGSKGGTIRIRGGQFAMDSAGLIAVSVEGTLTPTIGISVKTSEDISLLNQSALIANAQGEKPGSTIELSGRNISLTGGSRIRTESKADGKAGDIKLTALESVSVTGIDSSDNPTLIQSDALGRGHSGAITVTAPLIKLADRGRIETRAFSDGRASDVTLEEANRIELHRGGSIATYGNSGASSGNIHLSASATISISGQFGSTQTSRIENQNTAGETGSIFIRTNHLELTDHGRINLDTFQTKSGTSKPTVNIYADTSITLSNESRIDINSVLSDVGLLKLQTDSLRLSNLALINTQTNGIGTSGPIQINVGDMQLSGGSQIRSASPDGFGQGGNISITSTGPIVLTGQAEDSLGSIKPSGIFSSTSASLFSPTVVGNAGHIMLKTQSLTVTDNARIDSTSKGFARGNAGDITIQTSNLHIINGIISSASEFAGNAGSLFVQGIQHFGQSIQINGNNSGLFTETKGAGRGGQITTWSHELRLTDHATISSKTSGSGDAGNILIKSDDVSVMGGAKITAESTGTGNAGTVTIQGLHSPANSFLLDGFGSSILTSTTKTGAGGNITIDAKDVQLRNGGKISAETSGTSTSATGGTIDIDGSYVRIEKGALVTASTTGAATGGTIKINAAQTVENSGGSVETTATQAQAGDIEITAGQSITLTNGAITSTRSEGPGNAGTISIDAGQQFDMQDSSSVTAEAKLASGGNIDIKAVDLIRVANSTISSSVQGGPSTAGGNITIDPKTVVLQNAQILASAEQGNGGNIEITTPLFLKDSTSNVDASSRFGLSGTVTIQSPTSNISGTVGQLASKTSPPQVLLQNRCVALVGGEQSTFILAGRNTLPLEPGGWLSSPVSMEHWTGVSPEHASTLMVQSPSRRLKTWPAKVAPKSETNVLSLRRLTPPGFLVRAFATPSTGCPS